MPGLVPGIHVLLSEKKGVDGRDKPGHDEDSPLFAANYKLREISSFMISLVPA